MKIWHIIKQVAIAAYHKDIGRHAQSLSFATILSIVPLTTIFLGYFAASTWTKVAKTNVEHLFMDNLFPKVISKTFIEYINLFAHNSSEIKNIGLLFLIISICFLFKDMEDSFAAITNKQYKKWYFRIGSLLLLFIVPLFVLLVLGFAEWLTSISFNSLKNLIVQISHYGIVIKLILILSTFLWFLFLYFLLPHSRIKFTNLITGAICATLGFIISQKLFSLYLEVFNSFEVIYGVFSVIPIFLLWIYLNWQITLYGLLIAYTIEIQETKDILET